MLFDWSNQRLFNLYQPIIFRVGMKLTTIVLNMLFLFYKHDLTRTSLNICTENKNFPFWYEQLTYTTEWIFSNSAVLRRKVWDSKRLKEIIRNTLWKKRDLRCSWRCPANVSKILSSDSETHDSLGTTLHPYILIAIVYIVNDDYIFYLLCFV